jgi:hypothetical protein
LQQQPEIKIINMRSALFWDITRHRVEERRSQQHCSNSLKSKSSTRDLRSSGILRGIVWKSADLNNIAATA